jgi:hypothetical protein
MKGQINFSAWVLITVIIAIAILLIFDYTIRTYIIGSFTGLVGGIKPSNSSQISEAITNFTAYNCTSSCDAFSSSIYSWTINFNGNNYTAQVNDTISITSASGDYGLTLYPIFSNVGELCSNATTSNNNLKVLRLNAGKAYSIYYFKC